MNTSKGEFCTDSLPFACYLRSTGKLRFLRCEPVSGNGRIGFVFSDPDSQANNCILNLRAEPKRQRLPTLTASVICAGSWIRAENTEQREMTLSESISNAEILTRDSAIYELSMEKALTEVKCKHHLHSHSELTKLRTSETEKNFLIEGLLAEKSLAILVGDSGVGKSPFAYQIAVCVAEGIPFLGRQVRQGKVLYLDFENGQAEQEHLLTAISSYLGIAEVSENLMLWSSSDCADTNKGGYRPKDIILECNPSLVVVDTLAGMYPGVEKENSAANTTWQELRRDCKCSILALHHFKKESTNPKEARQHLEDATNLSNWMTTNVRGASSLITGTDLRLAAAVPKGYKDDDEIALVVRGYIRVKGEIHRIYLGRAFNSEDEVSGVFHYLFCSWRFAAPQASEVNWSEIDEPSRL